MNKRIVLPAIGMTFLGSVAVLAQAPQAPQAPQHPMSFFITSTTPGTGNLGGLAGADKICQNLATAAGAGNRTWHAYLSQQQQGNEPAINARDRIGNGPWYNAKGTLMASNVADLHGDVTRDSNNFQRANMLDEKGNRANLAGDPIIQHDIMTGSDTEGRAFPQGLDSTCNNWTSDSATYHVMLGHADRTGFDNVSWNSVHVSLGCTKPLLVQSRGAGHFYCFAIN